MDTARTTAERASESLSEWLRTDAYPLWSRAGSDPSNGGFYEALGAAGPEVARPRRARVQVRQIYAFARAAELGSSEDLTGLVRAGWEFFFRHYRRSDGLYRTLVAPDGRALDERAYLYDQAFVLLALSESQRILGAAPELLREAEALRAAIHRHLHVDGPGFRSAVPDSLPLLSNPHMHLLEAALSWCARSEDSKWRELAAGIVDLALRRFIDAGSGALREQFALDGTPLPGTGGRIIEPGHQFEWAWLLLRCDGAAGATRAAAARLVDIGEGHGVHGGVAINALLDDFTVLDAEARLWPQTERLKAAASMARLTHETRFWRMAAQAAAGLQRYLATEVPGLWYDRLSGQGEFLRESAPASSFYHIVCAIAEFAAALRSRD
jgi:mannose-6-phosphate isomerase